MSYTWRRANERDDGGEKTRNKRVAARGDTRGRNGERGESERLIGRRGIGYTSTLFYIYLTFTRSGDVPGP